MKKFDMEVLFDYEVVRVLVKGLVTVDELLDEVENMLISEDNVVTLNGMIFEYDFVGEEERGMYCVIR